MLHIQGYSAQLIKSIQPNIHWTKEVLSNIKSLNDFRTLVTAINPNNTVSDITTLDTNYDGLCFYYNHTTYGNQKLVIMYIDRLPSHISFTFSAPYLNHGFFNINIYNQDNEVRLPIHIAAAPPRTGVCINGSDLNQIGECGWKVFSTVSQGGRYTVDWYLDDVYECDTFYQKFTSGYINLAPLYQSNIGSPTRIVVEDLLIEF